jgi:hypothetical protein
MMMSAAEYADFTDMQGYLTPAGKEPKEREKEPKYKTGENINELNIKKDEWKTKKSVFKEYKTGRALIRSQIIKAVGQEFLKGMRDASDDVMGAGPKELFDYLKKLYGTIGHRESEAYEMKLNDPWDGRSPIDEYFTKLEDIREYEEFAGSPTDDKRCITAILNTMDKLPDLH